MRVGLFAYSSTGAESLKTLLEGRHSVVGVCTHIDDPRERPWFESVAEIARSARLPLWRVPADAWKERFTSLAHDTVYESLQAAAPDVILSASFRCLLPPWILALPRLAALNLHGSLLPRYRGRAPLNWVLARGERETGMTLHHMNELADAGDIVAQKRLAVGPDETAPELGKRLDVAACEILTEMLPLIAAGRAPRRPQDESQSTTWGRRRPEDGRFQWQWPCLKIHNLVRAVTRPFPGAFTDHPRGRLFVWKTRLVPSDAPPLRSGTFLEAGNSTVCAALPATPGPRPWFAGTGDGLLEIVEWSLQE